MNGSAFYCVLYHTKLQIISLCLMNWLDCNLFTGQQLDLWCNWMNYWTVSDIFFTFIISMKSIICVDVSLCNWTLIYQLLMHWSVTILRTSGLQKIKCMLLKCAWGFTRSRDGEQFDANEINIPRWGMYLIRNGNGKVFVFLLFWIGFV